MTDAPKPFDFSQFVPGFEFLKSLATPGAPAGAGSAGGMSSWVAPTLSVEEVDKRIRELKTVHYWLEQNGHALKATIQALEVQKMTLSTLRGMNVRMEDLAQAFTRTAATATPAPAAAPASASAFHAAPAAAHARDEARPAVGVAHASAAHADDPSADGAGVVDPLKWWGALTEQFQQIASSALQDAASLKMPAMSQPLADAVGSAIGKAAGGTVAKAAAKPASATKKGARSAGAADTGAKKAAKPARKRPAAKH